LKVSDLTALRVTTIWPATIRHCWKNQCRFHWPWLRTSSI